MPWRRRSCSSGERFEFPGCSPGCPCPSHSRCAPPTSRPPIPTNARSTFRLSEELVSQPRTLCIPVHVPSLSCGCFGEVRHGETSWNVEHRMQVGWLVGCVAPSTGGNVVTVLQGHAVIPSQSEQTLPTCGPRALDAPPKPRHHLKLLRVIYIPAFP